MRMPIGPGEWCLGDGRVDHVGRVGVEALVLDVAGVRGHPPHRDRGLGSGDSNDREGGAYFQRVTVHLLRNEGESVQQAEASARGEWQPGGSKLRGGDAYATSKQCNLATVLRLAREAPRLRFNAVEPGFSPATSLGREANVFLRFLGKYVLGFLALFIKYWSTPKRAAGVITKVLINDADQTGVYYDDGGQPMLGSTLVRDPEFADRVVAEARALLSTVPI